MAISEVKIIPKIARCPGWDLFPHGVGVSRAKKVLDDFLNQNAAVIAEIQITTTNGDHITVTKDEENRLFDSQGNEVEILVDSLGRIFPW